MATKSLAPSDTMVIFVDRVNAILEEREMSKSELARQCGLDPSTLRKIINGRGGSCTFATADRIAGSLGTSVIDILTTNHSGECE